MIVQCKSCEKQFKVPDSAIKGGGRLLQCSSCGNRWKQFPIKIKTIEQKIEPTKFPSKIINKKKKIKKPKRIKRQGPALYSTEYLSKKHGIKLKNIENEKKVRKKISSSSFGFYSLLISFLVISFFLFGVLNLTKYEIVYYYPGLEIYIDRFYEVIENIKSIFLNFISDY